MKKVLTLLFATTVIILLNAFQPNDINSYPNEKVEQDYHRNFQQFIDAIAIYGETVSEQPNDANAIRKVHRNCRNAYKTIEYIVDYRDPQGVKDYINGAPLLSFEREAPSLSILEPEGLQVLDEMVYEDEIAIDEVKTLVSKLQKRATQLMHYEKRKKLYDSQIFPAIRFGMIRVMSLGVTGFDTPGSLNGIEETKLTLMSMRSAMAYYRDICVQRCSEEYSDVMNHFSDAIAFVDQSADFDTFDRYTFTQQYVQPIYAEILRLQLCLGVELPKEINPIRKPTRYKTENIFSNEFFDPFYYSTVSEDIYSDKLVALGKTLFFDPILSVNTKRSCASCHDPQKAFTDGLAKSTALDFEGTLNRNSMMLVNSVYADKYFWDLRTEAFDQQIDHVIFHEKEFGTNYTAIVEKLSGSQEYQALFDSLFHDVQFGLSIHSTINKSSITAALSAYLINLTGFDSAFDIAMNGGKDLTPTAQEGFNLFMGKAACGTCHFAPTFAGNVPPFFKESESEVLGVPMSPDTIDAVIDNDLGRYANGNVREQAEHTQFSFKTVTVRNAALSAPYMHNGVYKTLEEVLDFYNRSGGAGIGIDLAHQTLGSDPLGLTDAESNAIIQFLHTLTDTIGMTSVPATLPSYDDVKLDARIIGGEY